jgi:hypothetical protein
MVVPSALQPKPKQGLPNLRQISVPRLEVQALHLLGRAVKQVQAVILPEVKNVTLWTDSTTTIQ